MSTQIRDTLNPEDYDKKTPIEHILHAPDTYIGSTVVVKQQKPMYQSSQIVTKEVKTCEGIERLFTEIISNAVDNIINTRNMKSVSTEIKKSLISTRSPPVIVTVTDNTVTVKNGGISIPVAPHPKSTTKTNLVLVPELIFGELLSSSNYDKTKARATAGRNGYGAKLANIFSKSFTVKIGDPKFGQEYEGIWENNMSKRVKSECKPGYSYSKDKNDWVTNGDSQVKKGKHKAYVGPSYVEVSYEIDFSQFVPLTSYSQSLVGIFAKQCVDYSFSVKIPIMFNGELLDFRLPRVFAKLYSPVDPENTESNASDRAVIWYEWETKQEKDLASKLTAKDAIAKSIVSGGIEKLPLVEMIVLDTPDDPMYLSFVNGLNVPEGVHINEAIRKVCSSIIAASPAAKEAAKGGIVSITPADVRNHISIILNCNLLNPIFSSQTKQRLAEPVPYINIPPDAFKNAMTSSSSANRWSVGTRIAEASAMKTQRAIAKTDAGKKKKRVIIDAGEDANYAGGENSINCVLYLCEGESAAGMIKQRINLLGGKNTNGYFPMKGKSLNVTAASDAAALANKEFTNIKKLVGLAEGANYSDQTTSKNLLRYGKIIIAADQDVDGFHVRSLLINMFASKWPSLIKEGRVAYLATPLVRVMDSRGKCVHRFFNESTFDEWLSTQPNKTIPKGLKVAYYKGLASSSNSEIKEDLNFSPTVVLLYDNKSKDSLSLAFDKKRANDRKEWILEWKKSFESNGITDFEMQAIQDATQSKVMKVPSTSRELSNMINTDLVTYSADTLFRAIPSKYDGLKRSQRQAIYHALEYWNYRSPHIKGEGPTKDPVKIARLAAAAAERVLYQHGEKSLVDTYICLAQNFTGANNISVLDRVGQFGCVDPETPIKLFNGTIKKAKSIKIGDQLIGDDYNIRNVLNVVSGDDLMYKIEIINQTNYKDYSFCVNSIHILTLFFEPRILPSHPDNEYDVEYFDIKENMISYRTFRNHIDATMFLTNVEKIIDISLPDFFRLNDVNKSKFKSIIYEEGGKIEFLKFVVKESHHGNYCGWYLDGNERFLLGNGVLTHNTRASGGKDAGAGRYISTRLDWLAPLIFSKESMSLVPQRTVEGEAVEPSWIPADLPLGVINESRGIATGYQSVIPGHHPVETADWLLERIKTNKRPVKTPSVWYNGFTGRIYISENEAITDTAVPVVVDDDNEDEDINPIQSSGKAKVVTEGIFSIKRQPSTTDKTYDVEITELPIGVWTGPYRKWLEALISVGALSDLIDTSTPDTVHFVLKNLDTNKLSDPTVLKAANSVHSDKKKAPEKQSLAKNVTKAVKETKTFNPKPTIEMLKLRKTISIKNMTMIDENGLPTVFKDIGDILEDYTVNMLKHYVKLKDARIKCLTEELNELTDKYKLILAIVTKKLIIFDVSEDKVLENIRKMELSEKAFENIKIRDCTAEKVELLKKKIDGVNAQLTKTRATPSHKFWEDRIIAAKAEITKRMFT